MVRVFFFFSKTTFVSPRPGYLLLSVQTIDNKLPRSKPMFCGFFFPYHAYGASSTRIPETVGYISNKIPTFGNKKFSRLVFTSSPGTRTVLNYQLTVAVRNSCAYYSPTLHDYTFSTNHVK